ncbi:hypothetical protein BBK82_40215 [Lentzea guizhouensis]|uniref:Uncharacterized protein n=1 Tax=Lentzea guizhouensis TaxID=1586287 RepID=A0A1B2HUA8_9PSEU|nr:hypothetical protein [Lentzea guizhouensis]ANZ41275.1 hypothetical protein BBK82_40215 [Lentzea guizhouensis]
MTTKTTTSAVWPLVRHGVEMLVAMLLGMALLGPLWTPDSIELTALWMAVTMSVPMVLWMRYRGHGRVWEMCAAMAVPYLVLLVPHWLGAIDHDAVLMGGHVLMVPAMAVVMIRYRHEHGVASTNPVVRFLGDRWPAAVAIALSLDFWHTAFVPPVWTLLACQAAYLVWGWRAPRVQLFVFGLYAALAAVVLTVSADLGVLLIAAGWGAHAVWDLVHHIRNAVVPRWFSEFCGLFDLVVAVTILIVWL